MRDAPPRRYVCCAGTVCCAEQTKRSIMLSHFHGVLIEILGSCTDPCPWPCLCLEVCCCPGLSVFANHYALQDRFILEVTSTNLGLHNSSTPSSWFNDITLFQVSSSWHHFITGFPVRSVHRLLPQHRAHRGKNSAPCYDAS